MNAEITALLKLIDDPDQDVYSAVSEKIICYGQPILPALESFSEHVKDLEVLSRVESLIHRLQFQELQHEFQQWSISAEQDLLQGAYLVSKYMYPSLDFQTVKQQFDLVRRNLWLELNNYLTPIEQINVLSSVLFNHFKFQGYELSQNDPNHYCLNYLLNTKKGNPYSLGILILSLSRALDIPLYSINIPRQFILAYQDDVQHFWNAAPSAVQTLFYLDPVNGMIFTRQDVAAYIDKINLPEKDISPVYHPLSEKHIMYRLLGAMANAFSKAGQKKNAEEVLTLQQILNIEITARNA